MATSFQAVPLGTTGQLSPNRAAVPIANSIVNLLDDLRHQVATHPLSTAGLVIGTIAIAIPSGEESGVSLDASSIEALSSGEDLTPASLAQFAKSASGTVAAMIDVYQCGRGDLSSCTAALLGAGSLGVPGDQVDELVGWTIVSYRYAFGG
jgi:hypothetical protein